MTVPVTVVIPVRDDGDGLRRCLDALQGQDLPGAWDIVVADNASRSPVEPLVAGYPRVRVVHEPDPGSYRARNTALTGVDAEVVAFTDADCLPRSDWLRRGLEALRREPEAGAVAGAVEVFARDRRPSAAELYEVIHAFPQQVYVRDLDFGVTANLFVRRGTLDVVGGFDPGLRSGGDADWGRRAAAAGLPVRYAPEVVIRHPARRRVRELIRKTRRVVEGGVELDRRRDAPPRTRGREVERVLRSCVGVTRRTWADPRLSSTWDRCRVAGVGCLLRLVASRETLRLQARSVAEHHGEPTGAR
jgi:GT2 family glycosyltransferase